MDCCFVGWLIISLWLWLFFPLGGPFRNTSLSRVVWGCWWNTLLPAIRCPTALPAAASACSLGHGFFSCRKTSSSAISTGSLPFFKFYFVNAQQTAANRLLRPALGLLPAAGCPAGTVTLAATRTPCFPRNIHFAPESSTHARPCCATLSIFHLFSCVLGKAGRERWVSRQVSRNNTGICVFPGFAGHSLAPVQATCIPGGPTQRPCKGRANKAAGELHPGLP